MRLILKYALMIVAGLAVIGMLVAAPLLLRARKESDRQFEKYSRYTRETLEQHFRLSPRPVKAEFRTLHPWKFLKLFKISVQSFRSQKLASLNNLDATMFFCMKMFTLMIRPDYTYNLPMLSVDIVFIGGRRVFVIEVIDPARIEDDVTGKYYPGLRARAAELAHFEQKGHRDWYTDFIQDFSVHIKADRTSDDLLFDTYKTYLSAYAGMAREARPLSTEQSARVKQGIETYVATLLEKGGPAVEVFEKMLGTAGQHEYVRTVMFGVD